MSDRTKDLYASLAKARALRSHAEECNRAIARRAADWLPATADVAADLSKRVDIDSGEPMDPQYNAVGALNIARGRDLLRKLRDGY